MTTKEHDERSGRSGTAEAAGRWPDASPVSPPDHAPAAPATGPDGSAAGAAPRPTDDGSQPRTPARWRLWGGKVGGDLKARPFPLLTPEEWRRPREALRRMYLDAERRAIEAYDWYMRDRVRKRAAGRALRVAAIVLGAAGGLQPLVNLAGSGPGLGWGYVLLASAGVCLAIDHFLGLSSRWMRDMITAQRIHQRLQRFQLDWAALEAVEAGSGGDEDAQVAHLQEYLDLLRGFSEDISTILIEETSEWINEFQSGLVLLQQTRSGQN